MAGSSGTKRRVYFIKKTFQARFIASTILLIVLASILSGVILYILLSTGLGADLEAARLEVSTLWQRLGLAVLVGDLLALAVVSLVAAVVIIHISHKIAGPLYRFEKICDEVGRGNFAVSTKIRQDDQLRDLADALENMVSKLRTRRFEQQELLIKISDTLKELRGLTSKLPELEGPIGKLEEQISSLGDKIDEVIE